MAALKCLILDNEPSAQGQLKDILVRMPASVSVDEQGRANSALAKIEAEHFDVCFIDLHLQDSPRKGALAIYEGISVIEKINSRNKNVAIVAYSAALEEGKEVASPLHKQCMNSGANAVLARTTLLSMSATSLFRLLEPLVQDRRMKAMRPLHIDPSLSTRAAVERIGLENIQLLLSRAMPEIAEASITAFGGGFSGAIVFGVRSASNGKIRIEANTVLKVSESTFSLQNELARVPAVGTYYAPIAPNASPAIVHSIGVWKAIVFEQVMDCVPLAAYIASGRTTAQARHTVERVVSDIYIRPAQAARSPEKSAGLESEYRLSIPALAALDATLREISIASAVVTGADRKKADGLRKFVASLADGKATLVSSGGLLAVLHGDLHAENVFVSDRHDAMLIDFERKDVYPRLYDIAALDADLMLRRIQAENGRPFDFKAIGPLERLILKSFPFCSRPADATPASRAELLRAILLSAMCRDLATVTRAEYASALAFQLLRYLKFQSIALPRRVLGVRLLTRLLGVLRIT